MKYIVNTGIILFLLIFHFACRENTNGNETIEAERNKEAREDSVKLATAYRMQSEIDHTVVALVETVPVQEDPNEDAADDPAIWINESNPEKSVIFGTNKKSGVHAYDLRGNDLKFYALGRVNNIDVRQHVKINEQEMDVLGGSNRSDNSIIIYGIDSIGNLHNLLHTDFQIDTTIIDEVYGFCMYKDPDDNGYAIVNGKNGRIHQYMIQSLGAEVTLQLVNSWKLNSQPEGMVADDAYGDLYIGEEERGIWKLSLDQPEKPIALLPESQRENNPVIEYDIEGLSIFYGDQEKNGFLLASIQGSFSYAVFDRLTNSYLGSFTISASDGIDGVEETDGLDISSYSFDDSFAKGILVVQDGFNHSESTMLGQNFKIVPLTSVLSLVENFREQTVVQ